MLSGVATKSETFRLTLGMAAPVAELEAWLESASAGDQAVYASGFDLPRAADGVVLARRWADEGRVTLAQRRDPQGGKRTQWLIEKVAGNVLGSQTGDGPPAGRIDPSPSGGPLSRKQRDERARMLEHLRDCAVRRKACPSNNALAITLELGRGERGRARAKYLLVLLAADGAIAVENRGRNAPRVVTITARGRAQGRSTAAHHG